MAKTIYKWDLEGLQVNLDRLREEKEQLEKNRTFLINLKNEIRTNWQSISGEIYLGDVETDTENLEFIIQAVDELVDRMNQVINQVYQGCENEIRSSLNRLSNSITPI